MPATGCAASALDAVREARALETRARPVALKDLESQLDGGYGIYGGGPRVRWATLVFAADAAQWVAHEEWHPQQKSRWLDDGRYELAGAVQRPDRDRDGHPAPWRQCPGDGRRRPGVGDRRPQRTRRRTIPAGNDRRPPWQAPPGNWRHAMKATWNGVTIAESDDTVIVEGNHYFPEDSLNRAYLTFSNHRTGCAWKGQARYHSLMVNGELNENAVWYYPEPSEAAAAIKGRVAFWNGVKVE